MLVTVYSVHTAQSTLYSIIAIFLIPGIFPAFPLLEGKKIQKNLNKIEMQTIGGQAKVPPFSTNVYRAMLK